MANGYFERGEIYWVSLGNGFSNVAVTRPGLIVSTDAINRTGQVIVVFLTTREKEKEWDVFTDATGKSSYIKCDNITCVSTSCLRNCIGTLNDAEMYSVEDALDKVLGLTYVDDTAVKEKEAEIAARDIQIKELKEEVSKLQAEIAARADDDVSVKVEIAMWQRLYEKALDQVCTMKLTGDVARRVEKKAPAPPEKPVEPEPVVEAEPKLVDINTAKFDELRKLGMSSNIILALIDRRPYNSVEDLKKVPGFTSTMYGIMSKKVCCVVQPKQKKIVSAFSEPDPGYEIEKVNINTVKAKELIDALGICKTSAYNLTGHRKKNGPFKNLEELVDLPNWSERLVDKYRDRLEV